MACLPRPVIMRIWSHPEAIASSTPYWMMGLSTSGSISLGWALVAGKKRVPSPAAGKTALRTLAGILYSFVAGARVWQLDTLSRADTGRTSAGKMQSGKDRRQNMKKFAVIAALPLMAGFL